MITEPEYAIDVIKFPDCGYLIDRARQLIAGGKRPRISYGPGVTFAVRRKELCKGLRRRLVVLYGNPHYAVATALHEAAHAVMMEELKQPNVRISGPEITFSRNGSLVATAAWMQADPRGQYEMTEELFLREAVRNAAGDIAVAIYCGIKEPGDSQDFEDFLERYLLLQQVRPEYCMERPLEFWKKAREHATLWISQSATKTRTFNRAAEFLDELYSRFEP